MISEDNIIYEQPLSEKIRTFLRLEHIFNLIQHHAHNDSEWDNRLTIINLLHVVDLLSRSDMRADLIKELEKHSYTLNSLKNNPNANQDRLNSMLDNINEYLVALRDPSCQPGNMIKQSELITSVKHRSTMPGGSCNFDLPNYHYWLNKPFQQKLKDINSWLSDLNIIADSLGFVLFVLRNSTSPTKETATSGLYQQPIEPDMSCQLIRVILPKDVCYYPEISGGKHRFTIRFMQQEDIFKRPSQIKDTIEFELHCCII